MGSPYKQFKTDSSLENKGITLDYGDYQIRIARAGGQNKAYKKMLDRKTKPMRRQLQAGVVDDERSMAILREVYAETVILGWTNVEDENGKKLPFTKENVLKVITDLEDLFTDIIDQASNANLFRADGLEVAAKNS